MNIDIKLQYDTVTGQISSNGMMIMTWMDLEHLEIKEEDVKQKTDVIALFKAGMTAEDITALKLADVI